MAVNELAGGGIDFSVKIDGKRDGGAIHIHQDIRQGITTLRKGRNQMMPSAVVYFR